ncbi:MAG: tyrosinase family protein [Methylocystis sp.]|nr:tyrosinase family protein [Methylocystis sp.]
MLSTRREFIQLAAAIGLAEVVSPAIEALAQPGVVRVRQNIRAFAADQAKVNALRLAVRRMKSVSASRPNDPKGWNYWASSHGATAAVPPALASIYNRCEHNTDHFLSWHRAFLFFFESVLKQSARDAGSTTDFQLPYWDWYTQPVIPRMFTRQTDPFGQRNSLYHQRTRTDLSDFSLSRSAFGANNMLPGGPVTRSETFSYVFEFDPHGQVHGYIGGDMGFVDRSARDPIFWLHHANIDRLWTAWMRSGARILPAANSAWGRRRFTFDTAGTMSLEMGPLLDSVASLRYRYDDETAGTQLVASTTTRADATDEGAAAIVAGPPRRAPVIVVAPVGGSDADRPKSKRFAGTAEATMSATRAPLTLGNSPLAVDLKLTDLSAARLSGLAASSPIDETSASLVLENVELGSAGKDGGFGYKLVATLPDASGRQVLFGALNSFSLSVAAHADASAKGNKVTLKFPLASVLKQLGATSPDVLTKGLRVTFEPAHFDETGGKEPEFVKIGAVKIVGSPGP